MIQWQNPGRPVVLASDSPRRRQILSQMGFSFEVESPKLALDESAFIDTGDLPGSLQLLASEKAGSVAAARRDSLVLGADTVVVKDNRVLGKPQSSAEAHSMLRMLSGGGHVVLTGVALVCAACSFSISGIAATNVYFRELTDYEIDTYIGIGEYRDKAGAYAIQGRAMIFVDRIEGCYYNVVGLPVTTTINLFQEFVARKDCADV